VLNRSPTLAVKNITPEEAWNGRGRNGCRTNMCDMERITICNLKMIVASILFFLLKDSVNH
jgi:hypothetical protein